MLSGWLLRDDVCTFQYYFTKLSFQHFYERKHPWLKDEQLRTARDVLSELDTFVSLPTGYGKSLCYAILPWAFDEPRWWWWQQPIRSWPHIPQPNIPKQLTSLTPATARAIIEICVTRLPNACIFNTLHEQHRIVTYSECRDIN